MRKILLLIVLLLVAAAYSAISLSPRARGEETNYFASSTLEYPSTISATGENISLLTYGKDSVSCKKATFTGELTTTSTSLSLTPSYSECTADLNGSESTASVNVGACKYELSGLKQGTKEEGEPTDMKGSISIAGSECSGVTIEVPGPKCTFEVPKQGPYEAAILTPNGEKTEVTSEISEATVSAKGCAGAEKAAHLLPLLAALNLIVEIVGLEFSFSAPKEFKPGPPPTLEFKVANESKELTIKNPYKKWPLAYNLEKITAGFTRAKKPGEPTCWLKLYLAKASCTMLIVAPCVAPAAGEIELKALVLDRGTVMLKL